MDGLRLDCKADTKDNRNNRRSMYSQMHDKLMTEQNDDNDPDELEQYKKYSIEITRENFYMFIDFLKYKNVDFIIAPYEADSQLAYMYRTGEIEYILSEDSDLIAYGCFNILRCLKQNGDCKALRIDKKLPKNASATLKRFLELSPEDRTKCCILAGCDYLPNIKGFGFGTIISMFDEGVNFVERIKAINSKKKMMTRSEMQEYFETFDNAELAFTEQLVYCSTRDRVVNLSSYASNKTKAPLKQLDERFVGHSFVNEKSFAHGDMDFDDLSKKRKLSNVDFKRILKFFEFKPESTNTRIGNLTLSLFTFNNFDKGTNFVDEQDVEREYALRKRDLAEHKAPQLLKARICDHDTATMSPGKSETLSLPEINKKIK